MQIAPFSEIFDLGNASPAVERESNQYLRAGHHPNPDTQYIIYTDCTSRRRTLVQMYTKISDQQLFFSKNRFKHEVVSREVILDQNHFFRL